jgi:tetratricopeptide (TPR) repeat protein
MLLRIESGNTYLTTLKIRWLKKCRNQFRFAALAIASTQQFHAFGSYCQILDRKDARMQVRILLDQQDRLAFQFHHIQKSKLLRQGYWLAVIANYVVLHVVFLGLKLPGFSRATLWRELAILGLAPLISWFELHYDLARKIRKIVGEHSRTRRLLGDNDGDSVITLTPDELIEVESKDQHTSRYLWANIEGVYETSRHIFVYFSPEMAGIIAKRCFPAPQEAQQFLQTARHYWQQANPEKKPDLRVARTPLTMRLAQVEWAPPSYVLVVALLVIVPIGYQVARQAFLIKDAYRNFAENLTRRDATHYDHLYFQAARLEDRESWPEARALYERLAQLEPKNPKAQLGIASANSQMGNYEHAETGFRTALQLDPESAGAAYGLGYLNYIRDQKAEATKWLQLCLQRDPKHDSAHYLLGRTYQEQGDEAQATAHFRAVLKCA